MITIKVRPYQRHGVTQEGAFEVDIIVKRPNGETIREKKKFKTDRHTRRDPEGEAKKPRSGRMNAPQCFC